MTESARGEGAMVVALLDSTLGPPSDSFPNYQRYAPVTTDPASVAPLTGLAIRLYTEPDTAWWRINRGDRYADMNACYLEKLAAELKAAGATRAEYIPTQGRGIQHGKRWQIVLAYLVTDQAFALGILHYMRPGERRHRHWYLFGLSAATWLCWQTARQTETRTVSMKPTGGR